MKKSTQEKYLHALAQTGNHTDAYFYIEENLTSKEAEHLMLFIGWLGHNLQPIGPVSLKTRLHEFATTALRSNYPGYKIGFEKMANASRNEVFAKADSFVTDNLTVGKSIQLHAVCYPLKNCTVVSYDPATKQVVLQLK